MRRQSLESSHARAHLIFCASLMANEFRSGFRLGIRMIHGVRRRGRAVAASPPHMKDRGLRESMKIKGGTNAPENISADRFETDGAETQLSPTTMPIDAINA